MHAKELRLLRHVRTFKKKEPFGSERKKQRKKDPTQVGLSMHSFNWQSSGAINLNRKIIKANIFNGATLRYIVVGMFTRLALIPSNSFPKRVHDLFFHRNQIRN